MIQFFELIASVILQDGRRTTVERVIPAETYDAAVTRMTQLCLEDYKIDMVMNVESPRI